MIGVPAAPPTRARTARLMSRAEGVPAALTVSVVNVGALACTAVTSNPAAFVVAAPTAFVTTHT